MMKQTPDYLAELETIERSRLLRETLGYDYAALEAASAERDAEDEA